MTKIRNFLVGLAFAAALSVAAEAQDAPTPPNYSVVTGGQVISATTSSAASALGSPCPASCAITLYNSGANSAYYALGGSTVTATTASKPLPPGQTIVDWVNTSTYVALITTGGSDTIYAWQGSGPVGSNGAGGTVTANQGAPNVGGATNAWPVQGAGTAGTPAGGVVSVQGVTSGTTIPVTAAQATAASLNATVVGTGTFAVQTTGNVGGYQFNASVIPTVQNASYTAGQSLGGLQTISIGSTASLSGILTGISVESNGGSVTGIVAYVWSKNPSSTTCTDKTNFVVSQTDNKALVNNAPTLIIPAIIVSGQDTHTYAASTNLVGNFVNGSANTDLYVCLLTNATVTPATVSDLRLNIQGIKDAP